MILDELFITIQDRIKKQPKNSYVAKLYKQGEDKILQKFGEEAVEVLVASKRNNKERIVSELADLFFITLILCAVNNISPENIFSELRRRRR